MAKNKIGKTNDSLLNRIAGFEKNNIEEEQVKDAPSKITISTTKSFDNMVENALFDFRISNRTQFIKDAILHYIEFKKEEQRNLKSK